MQAGYDGVRHAEWRTDQRTGFTGYGSWGSHIGSGSGEIEPTQSVSDRSLRLLTMIDEFTRECLAIRVARLQWRERRERPGSGCPLHCKPAESARQTARLMEGWMAVLDDGCGFQSLAAPEATDRGGVGECAKRRVFQRRRRARANTPRAQFQISIT
jgi:hypothetical protein